jgi:hypothetical protein
MLKVATNPYLSTSCPSEAYAAGAACALAAVWANTFAVIDQISAVLATRQPFLFFQ